MMFYHFSVYSIKAQPYKIWNKQYVFVTMSDVLFLFDITDLYGLDLELNSSEVFYSGRQINLIKYLVSEMNTSPYKE